MYLVTIDNNLLHDPRIKDYQILNPVLNLEVNKTNSFSFTIYPNNPMFNSINRLKSIIEVYDDGELIFRGRPLNDTADFNKATTIQCEGELAYLNDSTMEPYSYFGSLQGLLELYIDNHNSQVDASKQFTLGTVNVAGDFVRSNIEHTNTWEELSTKTFGGSVGGYLRLRRENDINYIDYLSDSPYISGQTIELSKNLLDYEKTVKASEIVTVLIPLGAKLKDEEGNELDERLTIESVNAGSKFVEHTNGISKYGRIVGYKIWDDINSPALLKTRATNDLNFLVNLGISIKIKAIDLNILDKSIPKIRFFEYVKIISKPHEIDDSMLIKKQTIHLDDPSQNTIEVGVEVSSFTDKQLEANNTIKIIKSDYITNEKMTNVITPMTTQISEIIQEADRIKLSVSEFANTVNFGSVVLNGNGERDNYSDWEFYNTNAILIPYAGLQARAGMTQFTNFDIVNNDNSLSGTNISFFGNGKAMNGLFRVLPEYQYSYRARRFAGSQTFTIEIHEFMSDKTFIKKTDYIIDDDPEISLIDLDASARFIGIMYVVTGVSVANQLEIGEVMFGIGPPKNYAISADSVQSWAESSITQMSDNIELKVNKDGVIGAINLTSEQAKITANRINLEGYATFTNLETEGETVINGGNILADTITSDKINVTGLAAEKIMSSTDSNYYGKVGFSEEYIGFGLYDLRQGTTPYFQVLELPTNGFVITDYNDVRRFSATGAYTRIHHSNDTISFDSTTSGTRIVFGNSEIGIDNTGPYYVKNGGSKVYF